jgi:hypothetical protein
MVSKPKIACKLRWKAQNLYLFFNFLEYTRDFYAASVCTQDFRHEASVST